MLCIEQLLDGKLDFRLFTTYRQRLKKYITTKAFKQKDLKMDFQDNIKEKAKKGLYINVVE